MKQVTKLTVIVTLVLIFSQSLSAQNWKYGLKFDLNYSNGVGNGLANKMNLGYSGGVWANYKLSSKFSLQPELTAAQYNYTKSGDFDKYYMNDVGRIGADSKIRMAYVNLPVLVRYDIIKWVSVMAGPQFGVAFFKDENLRKDGVSAFKNTEAAIVGGVQANLGSVGLYGRYTHGFTDISNMGDRYAWNSQHVDFGVSIRIK